MKIVTSIPLALLAITALGCSRQASTVSELPRPDPATASDTNTFGDSKEQATGNAEHARETNDDHSGGTPR